jgi:hypothetical protein
MAKNTGKGYRRGAVDNRTQCLNPNGHWTKRNTDTGQFVNQKADDKPFVSLRGAGLSGPVRLRLCEGGPKQWTDRMN